MSDEEKSERLAIIWSGEHRAYWRKDGCGYTRLLAAAWRLPWDMAVARTSHCGPEKLIQIKPAPDMSPAAMLERLRARAAETEDADLEAAIGLIPEPPPAPERPCP